MSTTEERNVCEQRISVDAEGYGLT